MQKWTCVINKYKKEVFTFNKIIQIKFISNLKIFNFNNTLIILSKISKTSDKISIFDIFDILKTSLYLRIPLQCNDFRKPDEEFKKNMK